MITRTVNRRSFLSRIAIGGIIGGGALSLIASGSASATDSDPTDPGGGSGINDRDPHDLPGHGSGGVVRRPRRRSATGLTDRDPGDMVGNGQGRLRRSRRRTPQLTRCV